MKLKLMLCLITMSLSSIALAGDYPEYSQGNEYKGGDIVDVGGTLYKCKASVAAWCNNSIYAPGGTFSNSAWDVVEDNPEDDHKTNPTGNSKKEIDLYKSDFKGEYKSGTKYEHTDKVEYGNKYYICLRHS